MSIKQNIQQISLISVLVALLVCRLFTNVINYSAIQTINFAGLVLAIISLYLELHRKYKNKRKFITFTGMFFIIFGFLVVFNVLLAFSIFVLSDKANDCIMLITLLLTLPIKFYTDVVFNKVFNE